MPRPLKKLFKKSIVSHPILLILIKIGSKKPIHHQYIIKWNKSVTLLKISKKIYDIFLSENIKAEKDAPFKRPFGHENTPQGIQSNKRGVFFYFSR